MQDHLNPPIFPIPPFLHLLFPPNPATRPRTNIKHLSLVDRGTNTMPQPFADMGGGLTPPGPEGSEQSASPSSPPSYTHSNWPMYMAEQSLSAADQAVPEYAQTVPLAAGPSQLDSAGPETWVPNQDVPPVDDSTYYQAFDMLPSFWSPQALAASDAVDPMADVLSGDPLNPSNINFGGNTWRWAVFDPADLAPLADLGQPTHCLPPQQHDATQLTARTRYPVYPEGALPVSGGALPIVQQAPHDFAARVPTGSDAALAMAEASTRNVPEAQIAFDRLPSSFLPSAARSSGPTSFYSQTIPVAGSNPSTSLVRSSRPPAYMPIAGQRFPVLAKELVAVPTSSTLDATSPSPISHVATIFALHPSHRLGEVRQYHIPADQSESLGVGWLRQWLNRRSRAHSGHDRELGVDSQGSLKTVFSYQQVEENGAGRSMTCDMKEGDLRDLVDYMSKYGGWQWYQSTWDKNTGRSMVSRPSAGPALSTHAGSGATTSDVSSQRH